MSLVDVLNVLEEQDYEMKKEASELEKLAAEEDAAGRIMARGFMDELNKLAADDVFTEGAKPTGKSLGAAAPDWRKELGETKSELGRIKNREATRRVSDAVKDQQMINELRRAGSSGLGNKITGVASSAKDVVKSYGKNFADFARGVKRTAQGE